MELKGTVGIVTGASRGLGVYIAETLARRGVDLVLAARSEEDLAHTVKRVEQLGGRAVAVATDVSRVEDLERLVESTQKELGPPDVLVNNAGIEDYGEYPSYDLDKLEKILRVNLFAAMALTRLALPSMIERKRGHIVNIASVAGKTAVPYNVVYSASKHGLVGFSWSLREEMKPLGIGVSVVCPGFVSESGMFADWSQGEKPPAVSRPVTPHAVGEAVARAVERDQPEIIVAKGLTKIVDVVHAISPSLATSSARRFGAYDFLKKATTRHQRL